LSGWRSDLPGPGPQVDDDRRAGGREGGDDRNELESHRAVEGQPTYDADELREHDAGEEAPDQGEQGDGDGGADGPHLGSNLLGV
jgi:hypothetical protein